MAITDLFFSRSQRTFHVNDSESRAWNNVRNMSVEDGAPGGLPPGVFAARTGEGRFNAVSPFAAFDSRFDTQSDGRGGSYVTEYKTAFSPIPGAAYLADKIHDLATDPREAYGRSSSRNRNDWY